MITFIHDIQRERERFLRYMFVDLADNVKANLKRKKTTRNIDEMQRGERGDSGSGTKRDQIWISTDWEERDGIRNPRRTME